MAQVLIDDTNLTNIANAIREKNSSTDYYAVTEMADAIRQIVGGSDGLPIGVMLPYGNEAAPSNWLVCDGRAVSRTYYAELFAVIGTKYGAGDGSTTFNLPDKRGKVSVGLNSNDSDFNTIGKKGGSKSNTYNFSHTHTTGNHTLTQDQIPVFSGQLAIHGGEAGSNLWNPSGIFDASNYALNGHYKNFANLPNLTGAGSIVNMRIAFGGGQAHNHGNTGSALGNTSISTVEPYEVDNWIIKAFAIESDSEVVLYENSSGSNGSITLNDNITSYKSIEIHFKDDWNAASSCVCDVVNGLANATLTLVRLSATNNHMLTFNALVNISGKTITPNSTYLGQYQNNGTFYTSNVIYITKVIGYPKIVSVYNNGDEVSY